ncbi:MAG: hypothetical protein OXI66_12490, partial [Boseongicola sp.]|nr:hypothetical protein [Boseongicola sp.]
MQRACGLTQQDVPLAAAPEPEGAGRLGLDAREIERGDGGKQPAFSAGPLDPGFLGVNFEGAVEVLDATLDPDARTVKRRAAGLPPDDFQGGRRCRPGAALPWPWPAARRIRSP